MTTKLCLFDTMAVQLLVYVSEMWGVFDLKEIDKLHSRFCKYSVGIHK